MTAALPADAGDGLTTARLRLRRYTAADLPALIALNADPDVMRWLGGPASADDSAAMLQTRILDYYDQHPGLGVWATIERASGAHVGFHLLNHVQGESLIQVGYRLHRRYWGLGYATEMSRALLHYGYTQRGLPLLMANTHIDNRASQHVLLKCGLHRCGERRFPHPAYASFGPLAYFERSAADWLAEQQLHLTQSGVPT